MPETKLWEHRVAEPWHNFKAFLAPGIALNAERPPEASLADHLAARRYLASEVVRAAHAVIDAIDQSVSEDVVAPSDPRVVQR